VTWSYFSGIHAHTQAGITGAAGVGSNALVQDDYFYFDVATDPAYFAMWKGDLPGNVTVWPPYGELGGLGVYSLLLFAGFGTAIAFGRRSAAVITLACVIAGAWLLRFYYAHYLYETKLVQLYPRTSIELAYCFAVITGFAIHFIVDHFAPVRRPVAAIGALCGLVFVIGAAGSSIADRYMPARERTLGLLAESAHEASIANVPPDPP
jgi:hypothetical protein